MDIFMGAMSRWPLSWYLASASKWRNAVLRSYCFCFFEDWDEVFKVKIVLLSGKVVATIVVAVRVIKEAIPMGQSRANLCIHDTPQLPVVTLPASSVSPSVIWVSQSNSGCQDGRAGQLLHWHQVVATSSCRAQTICHATEWIRSLCVTPLELCLNNLMTPASVPCTCTSSRPGRTSASSKWFQWKKKSTI